MRAAADADADAVPLWSHVTMSSEVVNWPAIGISGFIWTFHGFEIDHRLYVKQFEDGSVS